MFCDSLADDTIAQSIYLDFCSGTFVEFRKGMINVSPIGRNCSYSITPNPSILVIVKTLSHLPSFPFHIAVKNVMNSKSTTW